MKVLIFYASYGGGHLNAAKSIENCIVRNYPEVNVEKIDCMAYGENLSVYYNGRSASKPWTEERPTTMSWNTLRSKCSEMGDT